MHEKILNSKKLSWCKRRRLTSQREDEPTRQSSLFFVSFVACLVSPQLAVSNRPNTFSFRSTAASERTKRNAQNKGISHVASGITSVAVIIRHTGTLRSPIIAYDMYEPSQGGRLSQERRMGHLEQTLLCKAMLPHLEDVQFPNKVGFCV